ncbi:hypothetical protein FQR65_LT00820 [Abscondita terminalis]|nr:hypothetical protein FQR65_LT00820 [Abscondita terminalis]
MRLLNAVCMFLLVQCSLENKTETNEDKKSILKECIHEENPHPAHLNRLKQGEFVDDPKLKCFIKCAVIKYNEMTSNGTLVAETIKNNIHVKLSNEQKIQLIKTCQEGNKTDLCDYAYKAFKCITENVYKMYN